MRLIIVSIQSTIHYASLNNYKNLQCDRMRSKIVWLSIMVTLFSIRRRNKVTLVPTDRGSSTGSVRIRARVARLTA